MGTWTSATRGFRHDALPLPPSLVSHRLPSPAQDGTSPRPRAADIAPRCSAARQGVRNQLPRRAGSCSRRRRAAWSCAGWASGLLRPQAVACNPFWSQAGPTVVARVSDLAPRPPPAAALQRRPRRTARPETWASGSKSDTGRPSPGRLSARPSFRMYRGSHPAREHSPADGSSWGGSGSVGRDPRRTSLVTGSGRAHVRWARSGSRPSGVRAAGRGPAATSPGQPDLASSQGRRAIAGYRLFHPGGPLRPPLPPVSSILLPAGARSLLLSHAARSGRWAAPCREPGEPTRHEVGPSGSTWFRATFVPAATLATPVAQRRQQGQQL